MFIVTGVEVAICDNKQPQTPTNTHKHTQAHTSTHRHLQTIPMSHQQRLNVISNGLNSKNGNGSISIGMEAFSRELFDYVLGKPNIKSDDDVVIVW